MRNARFFAWFAMAAGMVATSASTLSAADWHDVRNDRQDLRSDYRDINHDYVRANQIRADIARDQARLNEDIRCGRTAAAWHDRQDIARDQRVLGAQMRDIRHDQYDVSRDRQDLRHDWR
jgi:hypothetical protein